MSKQKSANEVAEYLRERWILNGDERDAIALLLRTLYPVDSFQLNIMYFERTEDRDRERVTAENFKTWLNS